MASVASDPVEAAVARNIRVFYASSDSVSLCWEYHHQEALKLKENQFVQFQVRFFRPKYTADAWKYSPIVDETKIVISSLSVNTKYSFAVQSRIAEKKDDVVESHSWSKDSDLCTVTTLNGNQQERLLNLERMFSFLYNRANYTDYEEPEHVEDTYLDKASRGFDGLINAATFMGVGGSYVKMAKNIWKVRRLGLAALIFRQELQSIVIALGSQIGWLGKKLGLGTKEVLVGVYYYFWENKRERVCDPEHEHWTHVREGAEGVILKEASCEMIEDFGRMLPFSRMAYRYYPAQVQWILNSLETRSVMKLVCFRGTPEQRKPAFSVFADEEQKKLIISVRGTSSLEDLLTNHSFETERISFNSLNAENQEENSFVVHAGMYHSAKWLVQGTFDFSLTGKNSGLKSEMPEWAKDVDGGGLCTVVEHFLLNGYSIICTGHSLGGAVCTLTAILLADIFTNAEIEVYAFSTPPCVDSVISKGTQYSFYKDQAEKEGLETSIPFHPLFSRVDVRNFVVRDDMVPRLSLHCLQECVLHIRRSQEKWEKYVVEDTSSITERAKSLWAPNQRSKTVKELKRRSMFAGGKKYSSGTTPLDEIAPEEKIKSTEQVDIDGTAVAEDEIKNAEKEIVSDGTVVAKEVTEVERPKTAEEKEMEEDLENSYSTRVFVPGVILHSYRFRGIDKVSVVSGEFDAFNRIQAFENMKKDHSTNTINVTLRSSIHALKANKSPDPWQKATFSEDGELMNKCAVCNYFVGWDSSVGGASEAVEIRSTYHCNFCGKIVCGGCSDQKKPILDYGIIRPCRICDVCDYRFSLDNQKWTRPLN